MAEMHEWDEPGYWERKEPFKLPDPKKLLSDGIKARRLEILEEIEELKGELKAMEDVCPHMDVFKINKSNTGNYLNEDVYWVENTCQTCGKTWRDY